MASRIPFNSPLSSILDDSDNDQDNDPDTDTDSHLAIAPPSYAFSRLTLSPASPRRSVANRRTQAPTSSGPPPRAPVEHAYYLHNTSGLPWAALRITSNAASDRFLPSYYEGQTISGRVELTLPKPESLHSVTVTLTGSVVATHATPLHFWELSRTLWSSDMGDPNADQGHSASAATGSGSGPSSLLAPSSPPSPSSIRMTGRGKQTVKLSGSYSWPFAVKLPSTCSVSFRSRQPPVTLRLPPSFSEKGAAQFINYEINVRIRRGSLRIDSKLGTHFGYAPQIRPPSPSLFRRLAYQDYSPLSPPERDPDGWEVLPPITIRGKVFGVRTVEATCNFAIALPLTYTRGSPIPCMLTLTCADQQALDLVFTPTSTSIHLIRDLAYDATHTPSSPLDLSPSSLGGAAETSSVTSTSSRAFLFMPLSRSSTSSSRNRTLPSGGSSSASAPGTKLSLRRARSAIASAVWWPETEGVYAVSNMHEGRKRLEGEIMLPRDIPPSFVFGNFSIKYSIVLLPFYAPGFEPADKTPVFLTDVTIATLSALGPTPRSYAPPGHESQRAAHLERVQKPMVWGLYNTAGFQVGS